MAERISIALAACGGEKFLPEMLRSLLRQTRLPDEIVISDDSRDEATRRAVEPLLAEAPERIFYFHNAAPLGIGQNFSAAAARCTGDVVFFADQDDVWLPEKCEKLLALLAEHPEADGAFCDSMLTDAALNPLGVTHRELRGYSAKMNAALLSADPAERFRPLLKRIPAAGHNMAVRRTALEKCLPFPAVIGREYDTYLGYAVALLGGWAVTHEALTLFRQHGNNATKMKKESRLQAAKYAITHNTQEQLTALLSALLERLPEGNEERRRLLAEKRDHAAARASLAGKNFFRRLTVVRKECSCGRYARFGRGWQNAVQDLFLRIFWP